MEKSEKNALFALGAGLVAGSLLYILSRKSHKKYSFQNRVVLITGGSRGLGLVLARQFASQGARIAICSRNEAELKKAESQIKDITSEVLTVKTDLTIQEQILHLVTRVREKWGRIDVLINNAGIIQVGPAETMTEEDFDRCLKLHFWAPFYLIREIIPEMIKRKEGKIVNISSIGGKIAVPHLLPYSVSKFALTALSEGLSAEMKQYGIGITTVCPGLMQTGSPLNAEFKGEFSKELAWFGTSNAIPGLSTDAEKAAKRILEGIRNNETEILLGITAKIGNAFHGLFPALTTELMSVVNRFLPETTGETTSKKGKEIPHDLMPKVFRENILKTADRNNGV